MATRDASNTTLRRKQRVLYADKVVQQQAVENNLRIRLLCHLTLMGDPDHLSLHGGLEKLDVKTTKGFGTHTGVEIVHGRGGRSAD